MITDRRDFLKISVAAVALALSQKALSITEAPEKNKILQPKGYDIGEEFGASVSVNNSNPSKEDINNLVRKVLLADARHSVGKDITIEIRVITNINYGRESNIIWYTNDYIKEQGTQLVEKPILIKEAGFFYCGRIKT